MNNVENIVDILAQAAVSDSSGKDERVSPLCYTELSLHAPCAILKARNYFML